MNDAGYAEKNASALDAELEWFNKVLDTRIRLQFGHECPYSDVSEVTPPLLDKDESMYGRLLHHYDFSFAERVVFVLGLIPHVRPQMLDVFFTKNASSNRDFTEFGGRNGHSFSGFLPTGETALFILSGNDLAGRFSFYLLFEADHFLVLHNIVTLESPKPGEPYLSGFLAVNQEIVDLVTTGHVRKPNFGIDFPAKQIVTQMEWDDLVLDPYTLEQVLEIKAWMEHGDTLLHELGLIRKLKPGYRSLFYGPAGTGKTLTAGLLGKVAAKDVYRIDLSMVVSKYVGETEKNLEKVFHQAEYKNWILFFDEAEALFGKRTKISDAHDRFANQEVSYLLQRVEDYPGVVILASNLRSNMDEAFTRRFQSIIHFPMPRQEERRRLWENAFSEKTVLEERIKVDEVASRFELSGGSIMNVVRYATLMALKKNTLVIGLEDLMGGIRKELQKEGRTA